VAESTGQGKVELANLELVTDRLRLRWMLRQRIEQSPMALMISVNGFMLDARHLRLENQEEAFQKGLIPTSLGIRRP
jgi:hypothetical protein